MAKAKKTKPREKLPRWRVSLIKGTPAKFIDFTLAPDAETAERQVAEEHRTRSTPRAVMVLAGIRRTGLWNVRHRNLLRSFKLMPASLITTLYRIGIARSGALIR